MVNLMNCKCESFKHPKNQECREFCDVRKTIVIRDKKSTQWTFENPTERCACSIKIDNCIIIDQQIRKCDYLLLICDKTENAAFFIELKGQDSKHATEQILTTIQILKEYLSDFCLYARIALTKVRPLNLISVDEKKLRDSVKSLLQKHNKSKNCHRQILDYQSGKPVEKI